MLRSDLADSELRASMLRAIGLLPDVAVDERAVDGQGRRGIALVWTRGGSEGVRQTVIFDRATASVLEEGSSYTYDTPRRPDSSRNLSNTSTTVDNRLVVQVAAGGRSRRPAELTVSGPGAPQREPSLSLTSSLDVDNL